MVGFGAVAAIDIFAYLAVAGFDLLRTLIEIYFWGIFILVISSWVGTTQHPTVVLVSQVVDPYMKPFRNLIPPIGMIDISPMAAIFTLMFIRAKVLPMLGGLIVPLLN
jgi:YggT family protein